MVEIKINLDDNEINLLVKDYLLSKIKREMAVIAENLIKQKVKDYLEGVNKDEFRLIVKEALIELFKFYNVTDIVRFIQRRY